MQPSTLIYLIGYLIMIIMVVVWFRKAKRHGEKIPLKAKIFLVLIILSGPSVIAIIFSPSPSPISEDLSPATFYVAPDIANVRSCQSTSCDVVAKLYKTNQLNLQIITHWKICLNGSRFPALSTESHIRAI